MLRLIYDPTAAGAPDRYGATVDFLRSDNGSILQEFPKAEAGCIPAAAGLTARIDAWLESRGKRPDPLVVMVHGYMFDPATVSDTNPASPFASVYGHPPGVNPHLSWLPLVGECDDTGAAPAENAIAFAYKSQAGLFEFANACWSNSYQYAVFDLARLAARALASVLAYLGTKPGIRLRVLAHSLGTRTTSQALGLLGSNVPANLDRVVLLNGAEFCVDAAANFAGCPFDVLSVVNGNDKVLAAGGRQFCLPFRSLGLDGCVIGYDGLGGNDRWLDLSLDKPELQAWLAKCKAPTGTKYQINPAPEDNSHPFANLQHWSSYTNAGNRVLVRDLLLNDQMNVANLKTLGVPDGARSVSYGRFTGVPVPEIPLNRTDRLHPASADGPGFPSGGG